MCGFVFKIFFNMKKEEKKKQRGRKKLTLATAKYKKPN